MASCQQSNGGLLSCECDRCDIVTISGWFVARAVQNVDHGWVSAGNPRQNRTTDWDQEGRDRGEHHFKPLLAECRDCGLPLVEVADTSSKRLA